MATIAADPSHDAKRPLSTRQRVAFAGLILAITAYLLLQRQTLVDPIHPLLTAAAAAAGAVGGLLFSFRAARAPRHQSRASHLLGLVGLPVLAGFLGAHLARAAVGTLAFIGTDPSLAVAEATVTEASFGKLGSHFVYFDFGPGTREVQARASAELYEALGPIRSPGAHCLLIDVETGRRGIRRAMLPNVLDAPLTIDRLTRCRSGASAPR